MQTKLGVALAALVIAASPAAALQRIATYTGILTSGTDRVGVFTAPGTDLTGMTFTATYRYDTAAGIRHTVAGMSDAVSYSGDPVPTTDLIARLTINGRSFEFPTTSGLVIIATDVVTHLAKEFGTGNQRFSYVLDNVVEAPIDNPSLDAGLQAYDPGDRLGAFLIYNGTGLLSDAEGKFGNAHVSITGDVPEPATWALMLTGFGLAGVAVRRSRQPRRQQAA